METLNQILKASNCSYNSNAKTEEQGIIRKISDGNLDFITARNELAKHGLALVESNVIESAPFMNYFIIRIENDENGRPLEFDSTVMKRYKISDLVSNIPTDELDMQERRNYIKSQIKTPGQMYNDILESDAPPTAEFNMDNIRAQYEHDVESLVVATFNWIGTITFRTDI